MFWFGWQAFYVLAMSIVQRLSFASFWISSTFQLINKRCEMKDKWRGGFFLKRFFLISHIFSNYQIGIYRISHIYLLFTLHMWLIIHHPGFINFFIPPQFVNIIFAYIILSSKKHISAATNFASQVLNIDQHWHQQSRLALKVKY